MKLNFGLLHRAHRLGLSYRVIVILVALSLTATASEIFGIAIFLPIFQFIRLKGDLNALVEDSPLWQHVIDAFSFINIEPSLVNLLILSFSMFVCRQIFIYVGFVYKRAVRERLTQEHRNILFDEYIKADASYHDKVAVGDLVNVMSTEVREGVKGMLSPMNLIAFTVTLFGYIIILSMLSWKITLVSFIVLLLASRLPSGWIKKSKHTGRKLVKANKAMSEFLVSRLRSPRLIRLSGTAIAEKNEFQVLTLSQRKHALFSAILQARTQAVIEPIVIGLSLIFLYVGYSVLGMQVELIGLYLVVSLRLMPVVQGILSQWQAIQSYLGSIEIIENRLSEMSESIEKNAGTRTLKQVKKVVSIKNVSFRYSTDKGYVLKDITIDFKVNQLVALVGPSGSGKSTLIDLLPCLRLPTKGIIQVDGINFNKYTLQSIRQLISYVPQFPQIFNGSIKNHILYGKVDATDEELQEAIYLSGAKEFIDQLPQGVDTLIGEDAIRLSGGQRQRIDLSRALLKKAPILILDEPTSSLDAESEKGFSRALARIRRNTNTTIIVVSHRLTSILNADSIIVLKEGEVEEIGVHDELIKSNKWYSNACKMQLS
jgi:ABC-type multidrug transport system fused ATPase/permease subunit